MRRWSRLVGVWTPGVSTKMICAFGRFTTACRDIRVVCGLGETMATLAPAMAFTRVDFPAFARPSTATKPERNAGLRLRPRLGFSVAFISSGISSDIASITGGPFIGHLLFGATMFFFGMDDA